ncbi:hypothetical protein [Maribacter vaceletii]|nr:hypothetical protein [Maribacter vaceletii]
MKWIVLIVVVIAIINAFKGYYKNSTFSKINNSQRHWTATIVHIQLMLGVSLYVQSPIIKYFWNNFNQASKNFDNLFFGLLHIFLMLVAIAVITIGSAKAKRKQEDRDKYKTIMVWFTIGLILILIAIPWPFSPLASRPYLRIF